MAILRIFLILALMSPMALMTTTGAGDGGEEHVSAGGDEALEQLTSPRGASRSLGQYNPRATMTCDRFPRVCRAQGSPGPDCCRKQCVNVMTDGLNCGACGARCRYGSACCAGRCVNVMFDQKNCGSCKNRCKKGSFCKYGMCSYAAN